MQRLMEKLINLFRYFPEARQDNEKVFVNTVEIDAQMIFYHNAAKIFWEVVFDFGFSKVKNR